MRTKAEDRQLFDACAAKSVDELVDMIVTLRQGTWPDDYKKNITSFLAVLIAEKTGWRP